MLTREPWALVCGECVHPLVPLHSATSCGPGLTSNTAPSLLDLLALQSKPYQMGLNMKVGAKQLNKSVCKIATRRPKGINGMTHT